MLPPYYRNFGKRFVKTPKVYFTEPGLATWQLGIRDSGQVVRDPAFRFAILLRVCDNLDSHSCGLLRGAFRPPETFNAVRSVIREKGNVLQMRTQAIQSIQKALDQMNIRLHHAVSDIAGMTGRKILGAVVAGERDPRRLAALRDRRGKKSEAEMAERIYRGIKYGQAYIDEGERAYMERTRERTIRSMKKKISKLGISAEERGIYAVAV